jgi:hypothetical protein
MVALNQENTSKRIRSARFAERLQGYQYLLNPIDGTRIPITEYLELPPVSAQIFELIP